MLQRLFAPNMITMLFQRDAIRFQQAARRKPLDRMRSLLFPNLQIFCCFGQVTGGFDVSAHPLIIKLEMDHCGSQIDFLHLL